MPSSSAYAALLAHWKNRSLLGEVRSTLSWDQQVMMPPRGLAARAEQLTYLAEMAHRLTTDPQVGDWLDACESDGDLTADSTSDSAVNLREIRRTYDRATKLPVELVKELARTVSEADASWQEARKTDHFATFLPHLKRIVSLNIERAKCFGWADDGEPWDALADDYDAGLTARYVDSVLLPLRDRLVPFIAELLGSTDQPSDAFDRVPLPVEQQKRFVRHIAERIGFDFHAGRLDTSAHPFTSGNHPTDVRLTTRFHEAHLTDALGSTIHEAGHGMYQQGLPLAKAYEPAGSAVSLSIHESQSRLWENHVGRSAGFWRWCFAQLGAYFGDAFGEMSADAGFAASNRVRPGLIRVEADEATYHLHIIIRYEIERELLSGRLDAGDVPDAWNGRYRQYLDVAVPSDREGCLQDIHWSRAAMGYFPTYSLGSLYAAQFFEKAAADLGDLDAMFAAGEFAPIKRWLNDHVHAHGLTYRSDPLCQHVTGTTLSAEPFLRHLKRKLRPMYGG